MPEPKDPSKKRKTVSAASADTQTKATHKTAQAYTGRRSVKDPAPDANVLIANTMKAAKKKEIPVIGQRIKYFREQMGMEQKALAEKLGIISNAISNWECGRTRPDIALLPKIAAELGVSIDELFDMPKPTAHSSAPGKIQMSQHGTTAAQPKFKKSALSLLEQYSQLSVAHQFVIDAMVEKLQEAEDLQIYNQVEEGTEFTKTLAAGFDPGVEFDDKGETLYLYKDKIHPQTDCIFTVSGDSMEPDYHNGDKVMVQRYPNCGELRPGEVGAFITHNETYIKVYERDGLHSLNKEYKTMQFTDDDSVYLIGRVLGVLDPSAVLSFEESVRYDKVKARIEARMHEED